MTDLLIKRLQEELVKQRFNYKSLSLASGLGETTVRDIMIGRARNPRRDTLQKIARTLGLPVTYLLTDGEPAYYGTSDAAHGAVREHTVYAADGARSLEAVPAAAQAGLDAVRLTGIGLLPFLAAGSILCYDHKRRAGFGECLGKLCVLEQEGGPLMAGIVSVGNAYGRFNIGNYAVTLATDVTLSWCARVVQIQPA